MKRNYAWIAVCVALWCGVEAQGQPGPYGYGGPGLSLPTPPSRPYAPIPPMAPYAPNPGPIPMDPRLPVGQRPLPAYDGGGPKPGAAEPYLVQPDGPSVGRAQPEPKLLATGL